jgi:hypothetical protein
VPKGGGRGNPSRNCEQTSQWEKAGAVAPVQWQEAEKLVSFWERRWEENSTGEGSRPTSHVNCKYTHQPEKAGAVSPPPMCLERGKLVAVAVVARRTLSKQSLRG